MLSLKRYKNTSIKKIFVCITLASFLLAQTSSVFGAALIPGFYGSTSSDITAPSVNALPVLKEIVQGVSSLENSSDNGLIVHQDESSAIIDWDSFNIGANAWVHFDQQENSSWKALNRIYDQSPSLIYGSLTADGQVYLINQNGIFFSSSSTVNVGSLVASSLNIADDDFLEGTLSFVRENYIDPDDEPGEDGVVSNHGTITAADGGSVFLLGTTVENNGEISAYLGWAALAAGDEIILKEIENNDNIYKRVYITRNPGEVYNYEDGVISADLGQAGMYGSTVTQNGIIRSVTAVTNSGRVELLASEKVIMGDGSVTSTPVSSSSEEFDDTFALTGGEITVGALYTGLGEDEDATKDDETTTPERIELYGTVLAPSGSVDMEASERIYLGEESVIDVSGLWVTMPVSEKTVEVQLNSVELADDYGQKDGILLGETITISALLGSSIGDVSDYIISRGDLTAEEMATQGGTITLDAGSGDIIMRDGALLDVSGGGINYTGGTIDTTKLVSVNGVVYDISDADEWETYERILGDYTKIYERYGITETYSGIYYGGVAPLSSYIDSFQEGSDAGTITLLASSMVLDGAIDATVTQGLYQIYYPDADEEELYDAMGISVPTAGTLIIGYENSSVSVDYNDYDPVVQEIVVSSSVEALEDFDADDPFPEDRDGVTYISADLINEAGLDTLELYSTTNLTIEEDASISLAAGGEFEAIARSILVEGDISVPSGNISLVLNSNITTEEEKDGEENPDYVSQEELGHERIYLASGSSLSVAGEHIDNSQYGSGTDDEYETGLVEGGAITISDETLYGEGVIVAEGASIDVSGGYEIDEDGEVSGGDAGSLTIQGVTIVLEGDLYGYSTSGMNGGSISLHTASITVTSEGSLSGYDIGIDDDIPEELLYTLTLDDDFFDDTGFTNITLKAYDDIEVSSGVVLTPSYVKLYVSAGDNYLTYSESEALGYYSDILLIEVDDEYLGDSSITLDANEDFSGPVELDMERSGLLNIESNAQIITGQNGEIELGGQYIETSGLLYAPGGAISLDAYGITVYSGGLLSAAGYVTMDTEPIAEGLSLGYSTTDGGTVSISASVGDIVIEDGAVIDVSGSETVTDYVWDEDGNITTADIASAPGSVNLSFYGDLVLEGELRAYTDLEGLNGGALVISKENDTGSLDVSGEDLSSYILMGFDSITLKSWYEILFTDSMDLEITRDLTIDAPVISASAGAGVSLTSAWITLTNTYNYYEGLCEGSEGDASLNLEGDFIDIIGYVTLSSFETAELISSTDIRLSDYYYDLTTGNTGEWGSLDQTGELIMQADRIYPETLTSFTIEVSGDLTILDQGDNLTGSVYSAGASLSISAANIYDYGDIYVPLGEITLTAAEDDGIVYLGDGSTLSTYTDAYINYGLMDEEGTFWGLTDESGILDTSSEVEAAPTGSVTLEGENVVMDDGSEIDVSGGGTVFAYQFLSGTDGTLDPLGDENQYVILLDNSVYSPGETIVIGDNDVIPAGEYYVLSDEYAFAEGAVILTDLGTGLNIAESSATEEGYSVVSGTTSTAGTDLSSSSETHYYSVRDAEDVLDEGYYEIAEFTAGDAGSIILTGNTTILEGAIYGEALDDTYSGATVKISGADVIVTAGGNEYILPDDFDPTGDILEQISGEYINKLVLSDESVSGMGLEYIILGDEEATSTLTVEEDVTLEVQSIEFNAADSIDIEANAAITAVSVEGDSESETEEAGGTVAFNSPEGTLYIADTAAVYASDRIELNANTFDIQGSLELAEGGALGITSDTIYFVSDDSDRTGAGAYITQGLWTYLSSADIIELGEGSEIIFEDSFDLDVGTELILDASLIESDGADISISSGSVTFTNSGDASEEEIGNGTGTLSVTSDEIYLSEGTVTLEGFSDVALSSTGDVTIQGTGAFITGNADLNIDAASVASSLYETDEGYDAMDYAIDAGDGALTIASNKAAYTEAAIAGGSIEIAAEDIILSGVLNMTGAYITMTASGSGSDSGIFLEDGAVIYAAGNDSTTGGTVSLISEDGIVSLASGSTIDVSAGGQGDAGEIEIVSPSYAAIIEGYLNGQSEDDGAGGSFSLDTASIGDLGGLADVLADGGFDESIELRAREGDIVLAAEDTLTAAEVKISADGSDSQGDIEIYGAIDASGAEDGSVIALYAGGDMTLYSGSSIKGSSSGADITLSGEEGVVFQTGAVIDAGGGDDAAVTFRSLRTDSGLNMTLNGAISGAEEVAALAVKVYDDDDHDGVIDDEISEWEEETATYMADASTLKSEIFGGLEVEDSTELYFVPGLEIISEGDLTVDEWTLTDWRYDTDGDGTYETSGSLVIMAAGDLTIKGNIKDAPTGRYYLYKDTDTTGWDIGLTAGADLTAADPLDTLSDTGAGVLTIKSGVLVYTERGDISFSSAGDTVINNVNINSLVSVKSIGFNLATYDGSIYGEVGGNLTINGGAIQSSLGDIDIEIGGDLELKRKSGYMGSIRSVGAATSSYLQYYWDYATGGDITLNIGGELAGTPDDDDGWDDIYTAHDTETGEIWDAWGASFEGNNGADVSEGIVAMSGGDIYINAGGDVTAAVGSFGEGDVSVYSGGDLNGRFLVADGTGELYAAGDFGTGADGQQIELLDAEVSLTAGGTIEMGAIVNPTVANTGLVSTSSWNLTYATDTSVALNAILGDVLLTGETAFYDKLSSQTYRRRLLPANVTISAGRDILFLNNFIMAPASDGQLVLSAGRDISGEYEKSNGIGRATIYMSDMDPDDVYGDMSDSITAQKVEALLLALSSGYEHDDDILHADDETPVVIEAGGDVSNIQFYLPKAAEITAGGDITDIYYYGQNTASDDISVIRAGGDIAFSTDVAEQYTNTGIVQNGPGTLMVIAGDSIDLGTTDGIQSVGNLYNSYLGDDDNDLVVLAGVELEITLAELEEFFSELKDAGSEYSELLADGDVDGAEEVVAEVREDVIDPLVEDDEDPGTGDIDMVNSQINVTGGSGSIYIVALGEINVGKTTFTDSGNVESDSGIYTTAGGAINIFSVGDLNVNESRVMTFAGGDITVWTDEGDINAGRGSKASVNATESHAVYDSTSETWSIVWEAPAVGSGIRTLTFDPDGLEGPEEEPLPGDVYLFAPEGEIDAGEAGISGTNVILGATEIVNAQNIEFSQGSVGVPVSTASVSLSGISGMSSLADMANVVQEVTSAISESREESLQKAMETMADFITRYLNVEVLGFYEDEVEE